MNTKTIKKKKIVTALIALTLAAVSLAGCDQKTKTTDNNSSGSVTESVTVTENESLEDTTASDFEDITQSTVTTTITTTAVSKETKAESTASVKTKAKTQKQTSKASTAKVTTTKAVNQSPAPTYATTKVTTKAATNKPVVTTAKKITKKPAVTTRKATTTKKKTTTAKKTTKRATTTNYWCDDGGTHHVVDVGVIGWHKTYEEAEKAARDYILSHFGGSGSWEIAECDACGLFTTLYIIDNNTDIKY